MGQISNIWPDKVFFLSFIYYLCPKLFFFFRRFVSGSMAISLRLLFELNPVAAGNETEGGDAEPGESGEGEAGGQDRRHGGQTVDGRREDHRGPHQRAAAGPGAA